jgi:methionine synthase II (cobalamin-independent)
MGCSKDMHLAHAQHIGSLARPSNLLNARMGFTNGEISAEELEKITREAIASAVDLQTELHFEEITDGEFRYLLALRSFHRVHIKLLTCFDFVVALPSTKGFSNPSKG